MIKKLFNEDNIKVMATLPDESIDVICIDPPYLYLKNQKLERAFDETKFFAECKRLLTKNGFIVMFGRGTSFYRWNTILDGLGFTFKEEIIWDKKMTSSPVSYISRVHESISIFCKGSVGINKGIRVKYISQKEFDFKSIVSDIKRIKSALNNTVDFDELLAFVTKSEVRQRVNLKSSGSRTTVQTDLKLQSQSLKTAQSIINGMREKSIIQVLRDHYSAIHPTQKPVTLIVRILKLVIPKKIKIVVADFFAGSFSCGEAVDELQKEMPEIEFEFIGCEIDKEYFDDGKTRMEKLEPRQHRLF